MLSIVIAYGSFHLAEHFGFSGVLATVTAGILLSWEFEHTNRTDHYLEKLNAFWGVVEPSLLSLLFLLIGIEAAPYLIHDYWFYVIIIFIASILVRLLVVSCTIKLFSKMYQLDLKQSIIFSLWCCCTFFIIFTFFIYWNRIIILFNSCLLFLCHYYFYCFNFS